ncbi:MAG: transglycosylase domain-containing protein [Veillonellales bacterium]
MFSRKFWFLLLLIFCTAFWWSGGNLFIHKTFPASAVVKTEIVSGSLSGAYDRIYRIIALKSAVNAKLGNQKMVKIQDIPLPMQQSIIAVEDSRFYRHFGFDIEGILRATLVNMQVGSIAEGGSTITQQLARNLFLTQDRSLERKVEEVILAVDLELRYSKEEILEMYLNTVYFGSGTYGIGDAAKTYFGKTPNKLNLAESAMLAGLPNAPSLISPYVDFNAAKQRQAVVLAAMVRNGYIGPESAAEAKLVPIRLAR